MKLKYEFYLGLLSGAVLLYLALREVDYTKMVLAFTRIRWKSSITAPIPYYLIYVVRALRWRYLMIPVKATMSRNLFSAVAIGLGADNTLPVRIGEPVKAYTLGKPERVPISSAVATVVIERVSDTLTVLGMLAAVIFFIDLPVGYKTLAVGQVRGRREHAS